MRDLRTSRPGPCEEYIAGCDKIAGCVETLVDHVRSMVNVLRGPLRRLALYAEMEYLNLVKSLEPRGGSASISKLSESLPAINLMEVLVLFHDLGKCTPSSQRSLSENCTAPYHEITSATLLLSYLTFLGARTLVEVLPPVLAVLLHHHAMRGLSHVSEQICQTNLSSEDLGSILRWLHCASETIKVPRIREFILWIRSENPRKFTEALSKVVEAVKSPQSVVSNGRSTPRATLAEVYRNSIVLTAVLSVADNVAAVVNRRLCGRSGIQEALKSGALHGFVRYLLLREMTREEVANALRSALGVT